MSSVAVPLKPNITAPEEVLRLRIKLQPELAKISLKLRKYREEFIARVENIEKYLTHRFDPVEMDYRAGSRNQVLRSYYHLMMELTREPTVYELTRRYNEVSGQKFSKWTVRRYVREINRSRPNGMNTLVLLPDSPFKIYPRDIAACFQTFVSKGEIPSSREMIEALQKSHPEAKVTWYVLKKHMKQLRQHGLDVRLQFGELTPKIMKQVFLELKKQTGEAPSIPQILSYLRLQYAIHASRFSVSKMLENIRKKSPANQRKNWIPSRSNKVSSSDLILAYRLARVSLKARGINRLPGSPDIYSELQRGEKKINLSQARISERFKDLPAYPLTKLVYPHQDRVEETVSTLTLLLGRAPAIPEISASLKENNEKIYHHDYVSRVLRAINRKRDSKTRVKFTVERTSGVYEEDVIKAYDNFIEENNRLPRKKELLSIVLDGHPERKLSFYGFENQLKVLRKAGHKLVFLGNKPLPTEPRSATEETRLAATQILRQELHLQFADSTPAWFAKNRISLFDAALDALIKSGDQSNSRQAVRALFAEYIKSASPETT